MAPQGTDFDVVLVGSGMSGMALTYLINKRLPAAKICILEREGSVGGTWHLNSYPGAGCDVPSHLYSFSFAQNPNWSRFMSKRDEIAAYQKDVARRFNIDQQIRFNHGCNNAKWDEAEKIWRVNVTDYAKDSGNQYELTARAFVTAAGALHLPNDCDIKGAENFKGDIFHSARWNHKVDLTGKNVVVIGNGCSATQFVPILAEKSKHVRQFVRSMHYLMPNPDFNYSDKTKRRFSRLPLLMKFYRLVLAAFMDLAFTPFWANRLGKTLRADYQKKIRGYISAKCPEKYRDIIVPDFQIGCKRRVMDTGYLECLSRDNVDVTRDGLVEIKEHSVVTKSGKEYPCDAIVLANGFKVGKFEVDITGRYGETLEKHWDKYGRVEAYFSTCLNNFPNFFLSMGPNSGTGHYSYIFTSECQNEFIVQMLEQILPRRRSAVGTPANKAKTIEVTRKAEDDDVRWIDEQTEKTIVGRSGGCNAWYTKDGKNVALYPHYQMHFWYRAANPKWHHFTLNDKPAGTWLGGWVKTLLPVAGAAAIAATIAA
ncbi:hypothetical protein PYCC9005_004131 [Savitreella phatthalungensis]